MNNIGSSSLHLKRQLYAQIHEVVNALIDMFVEMYNRSSNLTIENISQIIKKEEQADKIEEYLHNTLVTHIKMNFSIVTDLTLLMKN